MKYESELYEELDLVPGDSFFNENTNNVCIIIKPSNNKSLFISYEYPNKHIKTYCSKEHFIERYKQTFFKVGDYIRPIEAYRAASNHLPKSFKIADAKWVDETTQLYNILVCNATYTPFELEVDKNGLPENSMYEIEERRNSRPVVAISQDNSRYPNICRRCGAPAWIGAYRVECSKCGEY